MIGLFFPKLVQKFLSGVGWRYGYDLIKRGQLGQSVGDQYLLRLINEFKIGGVVDVGANGGQYARRLREQSDYCGLIHSYEPLPFLFQELKKLSLRDPQWETFPFAVDTMAGKAVFNVMAGSEFSSLLKPSDNFQGSFGGQNKVTSEIAVDVVSFDDVAHNIFDDNPDMCALLKLDTQGTELRILSSNVDVLRKFVAVQVELSFQPIYQNSPSAPEVINWMSDAGFELSILFANNAGHFPHLLEMDSVFVRKDLLASYKI